MTAKNLLIIDGYGFIFRAYHVQPPLNSPSGQPVGALYGFTSMLLKVLSDFRPEHAVLVFDAGGKNFRHRLYDQYKANRPPVPEDLISQLGLVRDAASSLGFASLEKEGYEADDIIATLASRATEREENAIIISSDKDLMQLINGYTKIFDPVKNKYITGEDVIAKFGAGPDRVREVMALVGDSSDNVPGVPSIGPKTAAELIGQFGSVAGIYDSLTEVKSDRQRKVLEENKEMAFISWQLVGLDENVDLPIDFDRLKWAPPDSTVISKFLTEYGFKSLYKRAESLFGLKLSDSTAVNPVDHNNSLISQEVSTREELESFLQEAKYLGQLSIHVINHKNKNLALALATIKTTVFICPKTEGTDLFTFAKKEQDYWFVPVLVPYLADGSIKKITYNIKLLFKFFEGKVDLVSFADLKLMEYLLTAGKPQKDLFEVASQHLKIEDVIADSVKMAATFSNLYLKLLENLREQNLLALYENIDLKLAYVLNKMERWGVKVDATYLRSLSRQFDKELGEIEQEIFKASGTQFNIGSPKQLGEVLFEKMQLPLGKLSGKTKSYSTGADILEQLSEMGFEIADLLLKWRQLSKLKNTYTDTLPEQINPQTGRVHTTFLQFSTTTGRLSSHDPNLQNIPIRSKEGSSIRAAFTSEPGYKLISADYSQVELRILADIAGVHALRQAFIEGKDIHNATACKVFKIAEGELTPEHRRKAKAINFGIIYGQSSFGLAHHLGITKAEAAEIIRQYFKEYPEIEAYMDATKAYAREHGYVKNMFGRKCFLPYIHDKNASLRQFAERAAINAPIQGANADIIKIAMINLDREFTKLATRAKMVLQIHDELLFEVPEEEVETCLPIIKTLMEDAAALSLPLVVEARAGNSWAEVH